MGVIEPILWILFVLACLLVSAVILLQEGKGGGLGEAFGGAGAQTFGVKAGGITKFTGYLAVGIVVLAVVITNIRSSSSVVLETLNRGQGGNPPAGAPADGGAAAPAPGTAAPGDAAPSGEDG